MSRQLMDALPKGQEELAEAMDIIVGNAGRLPSVTRR